MTNILISNESGVACDEAALGSLAVYLLAALRLHPQCELGVTLVDLERMTTLHEDWMNEPGATDVLSFPIDELRSSPVGVEPEEGMLGDIVLCPSFLGPQCAESGRSLDQELQFLLTHGVLHLIGFDHATQEDYDEMFALQDTLLGGWVAA